MSPEILLVVGCVGLGLVISYAWWIRIRVTLFQARLLEIRDELDAAVSANQTSSHPSYAMVRAVIDWLIDFSPFLSVPVFLFYRRHRTRTTGGNAIIDRALIVVDELSTRDALLECRHASDQVFAALLVHVCLTPSFLATLLLANMFGQSERLAHELSGMRGNYRELGRFVSSVK